ncbi:hypothetical protein GCM10009769_21030 [Curtobacterium luteum]|uniref:Uncharacterized protein n=1 Tax=Curtobacterium luteum TaxID=33881 RepID=A0A8H9L0S8_9MICO|nr:hypothetical protein GCM10009769_21030 [Curtobacterium luteum]
MAESVSLPATDTSAVVVGVQVVDIPPLSSPFGGPSTVLRALDERVAVCG